MVQHTWQKFDKADFQVNFELFFRNIHNLNVLSDEDSNFVKGKTKETTFYSIELITVT